MSLFLTVFFCVDGFLKVCLCTRGFLKVSILEWQWWRFPMKFNLFQHCWTLFWLCKLGHGVTVYVFKGSFGPPIHVCPPLWICYDPRFTGSGVSPSFLLSPAKTLSWLSVVLTQKEAKWEVTGALLRTVLPDLGPRETPEGPWTSSQNCTKNVKCGYIFLGNGSIALIICLKGFMTHKA